ncbi:MAG: metal-sulfur cluster assembly factor [Planctomycetia bacterium]|nr:metal-sulfur cluster assembly factor [Planctomycetia bacterium]
MPATRATGSYEVKVEGQGIFVRIGHGPTSVASAPPTPATAGAPVESKRSVPDSSAAAATAPQATVVNASEASPVPTIAEPGEAGSTAISEDSIREALKQVIDPELFVNIVDLGLIYGVTLNERPEGKSHIAIDMTMTSPACPAGPQLIQNSKDVLKRIEGVEEVEVKLVMIPPWTPDRMTEAARDQLGIF